MGALVVAAVQAEPAWLDARAGAEKAVRLIAEAAQAGAALVAFPETWIPGYPAWIWLGSPFWGAQFVGRYHENSILANGEVVDQLRRAARQHRIAVVMGASERAGGSLYMAQITIGPDGEVYAMRRKLKPTGAERAVFGEGDGSDLVVTAVPGVGRVGALNCWEHLQPLTKFAMYSQDEQVHVAAWPNLGDPQAVYALSHEANLRASQLYALEGGCYVLASTTMLGEHGLRLFAGDDPERVELLGGGSPGYAQVFAPGGRPIGRELPPDQEGLVLAEIDLAEIPLAKSLLDPAGHYGRADVTRLLWDPTPRRSVVRVDHGGTIVPPVVADRIAGPSGPGGEQRTADSTTGA